MKSEYEHLKYIFYLKKIIFILMKILFYSTKYIYLKNRTLIILYFIMENSEFHDLFIIL